jgi:hypothetical protein
MTTDNTIKANNSLYFKSFNEDYQAGGIYHKLDSYSFRVIVTLQAYADGRGYVGKSNTTGYSKKELCEMFSINYRTLLKVFDDLKTNQLIQVDENGNSVKIWVLGFVSDQVYRENNNKKSTRGKMQIAQRIAGIQNDNEKIKNALSLETVGSDLVNTKTGEIL